MKNVQLRPLGRRAPVKFSQLLLAQLALGALLTTQLAAAQDDLDDAESTSEDSASEDSASEDSASEDSAVEASVSANVDLPDAPAQAGEKTPDGSDSDTSAAYGVRLLPGSAYLEPHTRGLAGGSLAGTMHGLQWPYLPEHGTTLGLSGYGWVDTGYEQIDRGDPNQGNTTFLIQQGRFALRATPTYSAEDDWFVQGQAELIANADQSLTQPFVADTDDLWVKIGQWNSWDLQLGRYEAFELYHFGMGLDLNTLERRGAEDTALGTPEIYGVTYGFYRRSGIGNVGLHVYPTDFLRFELLGQLGNESGLNAYGGRPAAILDLGWIKAKVGAEYRKQASQSDSGREERERTGYGGALQFVFEPWVEFGFNGAYGTTTHTDIAGNPDAPGSGLTYSYGGFANVRIIDGLLVGIGSNFTWKEDEQTEVATGRVGEFSHTQSFLAIQYSFLKHFALKAVVAQASARFAPTFTNILPYDNDMLSGRLRASVGF